MNAREVQDLARRWSYRRQRLGEDPAPDAGCALRAVVAVYSAHPIAPLSLRARVKRSFGAAAFRRLDGERVALRVPAMRGSIHVLPRETAHLAFRATAAAAGRQDWRLRNVGISDVEYGRLREEILSVASEPRTTRQLRAGTGYEGPLSQVLQTMTFEGALLRVGAESLRSNAVRYVAADRWLGEEGLPGADPDAALAWLAGEYLRAFGPARLEDFRWWAGVTKERAAAALATVGTAELGDGYLLPAVDRGAFEAAESPSRDSVDLLPKWDCYTMGYAPDGRRRFVHPHVQERVYTLSGDGLGVVLVDGTAAEAWEARFRGGTMQVGLDLSEPPGPQPERVLTERFGAVAALLVARSVSFGGSPRSLHEDV